MDEKEKSLFDEIWEAAGLNEQPEQAPTEEPSEEVPVEDPAAKEAAEEPAVEEPKAEEPPAKKTKVKKEGKSLKKPKKETVPPARDHTEKKKSVRFLVIYTIVFVAVITALISGSYMISQRIHQESNEAQSGNEHQSTLQNIKDKNEALKKENESLKEQNESLTLSEQDSAELLDSAADMVEHQEYLSAAMAKYIDGSRTDARAILATVDREKLSPTAQEYYDLLDQKLN